MSSATAIDVDFGRIARVYARFRPPFPKVLFERLYEVGVGAAGQKILDLGTGTGALSRKLAEQSCLVTGLDKSGPLIQQAMRMTGEESLAIRFIQATAEDTGLPDASFGAVTASQAWHWFDGTRAAKEAMRVLKPEGTLAIIAYDWVPSSGSVAEATEELILNYNPTWMLGGGTGLHPVWMRDLVEAGFQDIESFSFDVEVPFSREAWRGRVRASAGVAASLDADLVARFDDALRVMIEDKFPQEPLRVQHRVFVAAGIKPVLDDPAMDELT